MRRTKSHSMREEIKNASTDDGATKCIGERCQSWWYCSHEGHLKVKKCTADLSTGFYHDIPYPTLDYKPLHPDFKNRKHHQQATHPKRRNKHL